MGLFLQVVGGLVIALIVLAFVALKLFKWWLRRKLGEVCFRLAELGEHRFAARVTLQPDRSPWHHLEQVSPLIAQLEHRGYVRVGQYLVPEMAGIMLWAAVHPGDGTAAVVYDHSAIGVFFDVVAAFEGGGGITVSTTPTHDPANVPPGRKTFVDRSYTVPQALEVLHLGIKLDERPLLRLDMDNFVAYFLDAYAEHADWTLAREPVIADLERVQAQLGGPQNTPEEKEEALRLLREQRVEALEEALLDRFLESGQVSARDWRRLEGSVILVHDRLSAEQAAELALQASNWALEHPPVAALLKSGGTPSQIFAAIQEMLPVAARHRCLGEVARPLPARVFEPAVLAE